MPNAKRIGRLFNLTIENFNKILDYERGLCPLCGRPLIKPNVDHCHKTGLVRGLLCSNCNRALGRFRDDINRLRKAVEYLLNPPATAALGKATFGLPGRVDTKKQRKLFKKLQQVKKEK